MTSQSDEVFLIAGDNVSPLRSRPFKDGLFGTKLEDALQTLIEKQPNIINGRQIDPGNPDPPRFVLLRREMQVGDWSLDHLLVDQRGVLTLVEAKLLQNPEARRAVIGQILDYAANAAENWSNGRLRQSSEEYWQDHQKKNLDEILDKEFPGIDIETFWGNVETNLAQSTMRLIIAADELRPEVRRIIEFLNEQLKTVQVFGLEIRCYGEDPHAVVVPFLIGQTQATASKTTGTGQSRNWTTAELREAYAGFPNQVLGQRLTNILDWAIGRNCLALPGDTKRPVFGLAGHSGQQIISIAPTYTYAMLKVHRYAHPTDRDRFASDLQRIGMFSQDLDLKSIDDGKNLSRKLEDLSDQEFAEFMVVLDQHCRMEAGER